MKFIVLIAACLLEASAVGAQTPASLIIRHARIFTQNDSMPEAEAIAVDGNVIRAVGTSAEVMKYKDANTREIDAGGRTLIPGLSDSHLHVIRTGRFYNLELRWDGVKTLSRALQMLKEQAARTPKGQWVRVVGGWNKYQFQEKRLPTLEEINAATGNVPCFILYLYDHAYLNRAGIRALGYDTLPPSAPQGLLERDDAGHPTGLLVAEPNAYILYYTLSRLPSLDTAATLNSTRQFMWELNRLGLTSVLDAGGGFQNFPEDYWAADSLNKLGQLTLRMPYYLFVQKAGRELADFKQWMSEVELRHDSSYGVEGGGENLVMSAADFEKFASPRPELSPQMDGELKVVLTQLMSKRWPFRLHATYDQSISRFLTVIEEVNRQYPINGIPWIIDHAETVSEQNLERIHALGGSIAIQDRMAFQGEIFIDRYGMSAAGHAPPIGTIRKLGIPVGMGTDGTRVSSFNPWIGLYWLVTGKTIGGTEHLSSDNRLSRADALSLFTSGSASLVHEDGFRGKLKEGYLADFTLLDKDYFSIPEEEIKSISAVLTVVDGKIVWAGGPFKQVVGRVKAMPAWAPVNFYGGYQPH